MRANVVLQRYSLLLNFSLVYEIRNVYNFCSIEFQTQFANHFIKYIPSNSIFLFDSCKTIVLSSHMNIKHSMVHQSNSQKLSIKNTNSITVERRKMGRKACRDVHQNGNAFVCTFLWMDQKSWEQNNITREMEHITNSHCHMNGLKWNGSKKPWKLHNAKTRETKLMERNYIHRYAIDWGFC